MSWDEAETAWTDFRAAFFAAPNELSATGDPATEKIIGQAEGAWLANPAAPFFLPVRASPWTYWYVVCPDQEQQLWVRDLIRAHIGSWTDFSGLPVPADSDLPMDVAVRSLTGPRGCAFRLLIPRNDEAEAQVRQILDRLTRSLAARGHRRIHLVWPLGRLIGDFWDACADGAQAGAAELLDLLERDPRLSKTNRLFLRLQYLAVFEEWVALEALDQLPDLVRLDRPVLASDALARLAMARLPADAALSDFERSTSSFGCLVGSVSAIRSAAGAQYYAYWSLSSGEAAEAVTARLLEAGWLDQAHARGGLAVVLTAGGRGGTPTAAPDLDELRTALAEGRSDAAIAVLALAAPSADLLPVLIELVTRTLTPASIALLQRWREQLGEDPIQDVLSAQSAATRHELDAAAEPFGTLLERAFSTGRSATERGRELNDLRAQAVPRLMQAGALREVIEVVQSLSRAVDTGLLAELIDLLLDMERDLFAAASDVPGLQDLRRIVVESWALGDESGDRHRAGRLVDLVGRALIAGLSPAAYDDVVESLRAGWAPFLTDADLPFGLETIEILDASEPESATALRAFALMILSRIGDHNARRIDAAVLETAVALAPDFGLQLAINPEPEEPTAAGTELAPLPAGTSVVIYSLMEPAATRAAAIVRRWYPEVRVTTFAGKVASDALRHAAKKADLLVIADKAASHAATDALKAARGHKPIHYARGKGTASLIEAASAGLKSISS
jgi:hypothetical protein